MEAWRRGGDVVEAESVALSGAFHRQHQPGVSHLLDAAHVARVRPAIHLPLDATSELSVQDHHHPEEILTLVTSGQYFLHRNNHHH